MAFEPLKYIYEKPFAYNFGKALKKINTSVDITILENEIYSENWEKLELKERMKHLTSILHKYLNSNFEKASLQIIELISCLDSKDYKYSALAFLFLPDYIETYGKQHFEISMKTIENITAFSTCEFAVRPFIKHNPERAFEILYSWSRHKNFHLRRLASEGCRPKLPWAMALKDLQKDPSPIIPILENLKNDSEDYVYRSVANNLNDISKNHPELVLNLCAKWKDKSKNTDWLVKHALRTLLKAGNQKAMKIFGYGDDKNISIQNFKLKNVNVKIGTYLEFSFELQNKKKALNRLEYAIYFRKQNGDLGKKVFKISEKEYQAASLNFINKKHSFKIISTRKYHKGEHQISIIINGIEKGLKKFNLV